MAAAEHVNGTGGAEAGPGPSSVASSSGILSPKSPRASADLPLRAGTPSGGTSLEAELERTRQEKDQLSHQYRTLLGKLTAMRNTLGEKLKEDAEELDRREAQITELTEANEAMQGSVSALRTELESATAESKSLSSQLHTLKSQSDSSSSDVLSLTREMRELRGEMERLRAEREALEDEAERERSRREALEEEVRAYERRDQERRHELDIAMGELSAERERASNLQEVLTEFQEAKDMELRQATAELDSQLRRAVGQLSEYKLRAANAESSLSSLESDASRAKSFEKEMREKNALIAKLRHDSVVTNEHLTEALRRLRKNTSDTNVDRRLVTNVLISFLTTSRADSKRFEMLSLLSTILGWDDSERERAGLQRSQGKSRPQARRKSSAAAHGRPERTAEEEAAMNESFSNLFVEFLLKESAHGRSGDAAGSHSGGPDSPHSPSASRSPVPYTTSPPASGANSPMHRMSRTMSSSSVTSVSNLSLSLEQVMGAPGRGGTPVRKPSFGLQEAMGRQ